MMLENFLNLISDKMFFTLQNVIIWITKFENVFEFLAIFGSVEKLLYQ